MAPSSKRKYDSYESSSAGPSNNDEQSAPPVSPTPELQELYNNWRRLEDLDSHIKEQTQLTVPGNTNDGQNDLLSPTSPGAASMSRTPSRGSTANSVTHEMNSMAIGDQRPSRGSTANSVTHEMNSMAIGDQRPSSKRKQGRTGPLDAPGKARTAFVRKIRACTECHRRRVKCSHHNFRLFEEAYQASKQTATATTQQAATNLHEHAQHQDLFGVGGRPNLNVFPPENQPAFPDFAEFLSPNHQPSQSPNTAPLYNFSPRTCPDLLHVPPPSHSRTSRNPQWPGYIFGIESSAADRHVPIGRQIRSSYPTSQDNNADDRELASVEEWECRYGDDCTASSSHSAVSESEYICLQRYDTLDRLANHFQAEHAPFENGTVFLCCTRCGQHYVKEWWATCPSCQDDVSLFQEQWYWGDICTAGPGATSDRTSIKVNEGGGGHPSLARNETITQFNMYAHNAAGGRHTGRNNNGASFSYGSYYTYSRSPPSGHTAAAAGGPIPQRDSMTEKTPIPTVHVKDNGNGNCMTGGEYSPKGAARTYCPLYAYRRDFSSSGRSSSEKRSRSISCHALRLRTMTVVPDYHTGKKLSFLWWSSLSSSQSAFLRLLILSLVTLAITHGWFSSSWSSSSSSSSSETVLKQGQAGGGEVERLPFGHVSVLFILVGLLGMWLVRHVRTRLMAAEDDERRSRRQLDHRGRRKRCFMRDIIGPLGMLEDRGDLERFSVSDGTGTGGSGGATAQNQGGSIDVDYHGRNAPGYMSDRSVYARASAAA